MLHSRGSQLEDYQFWGMLLYLRSFFSVTRVSKTSLSPSDGSDWDKDVLELPPSSPFRG